MNIHTLSVEDKLILGKDLTSEMLGKVSWELAPALGLRGPALGRGTA